MLSTVTKLASLAIPRKLLTSSSSLASALKDNSETLENTNDMFTPLISRFQTLFLWEQLPTDLKYSRDYIVEEASAAPAMISGMERAGIMADHCGMCRFGSEKDQGFRMVVASLRRYVVEAPAVVAERHVRAEQAAAKGRREEANDLIKSLGDVVMVNG